MPQAFSLRDLAANTIFSRNGEPVGHSFVEEYFDPANARPLQEAMGAVDASAFAGITGQLLINRVLAAFTAGRVRRLSKLIPTLPTRLNGERIPGVALPRDPGEDFVEAEEMDALHYVGFSEEYVRDAGHREAATRHRHHQGGDLLRPHGPGPGPGQLRGHAAGPAQGEEPASAC